MTQSALMSSSAELEDSAKTRELLASPPVVNADLPPELVADAVEAVERASALTRYAEWSTREIEGQLELVDNMLNNGQKFLFDDWKTFKADKAIAVGAISDSGPLWFIGDLHGDLLSLELALRYIAEHSIPQQARVVFLGDLFDAGPYGAATVLAVWKRLLAEPSRTALLAGNHDEALQQNSDGTFVSAVTPSDLAEWINGGLSHSLIRKFGELTVRTFAAAPRAFFLPDGMLVAHAGFPMPDLYDALRENGDWNSHLALQDFVWTRFNPKKKRVRPHRNARDVGYGTENVRDFGLLASELGRPVKRLVRGHDHLENCFEVVETARDEGVVTINTMCTSRILRAATGPYQRTPAIALFCPGKLPQVHRLSTPAEAVLRVYPPEGSFPTRECAPPGSGE